MQATLVLQIPKGTISPLCSHATPKGSYEEGFKILKILCKRSALGIEGVPIINIMVPIINIMVSLLNILMELFGVKRRPIYFIKCAR